MMGDIFYIFGLLVLILNFSILINYNKIFNTKIWISKFTEISGNPPKISDFRSKDEYNVYTSSNVISIVDFFWFLIGLISNSWFIFIGFLVFQFLFKSLVGLIKFEIIRKYMEILFQFSKILIILALILNHFHFHTNWLDLI